MLAHRAAKRECQRRRRRGWRYRSWRHVRRDQQAVARRRGGGRIDLVSVTGWGVVSSFLRFLEQLEDLALLEIEGTGFQRVLIPIARQILTAQLKVLLGIGSIELVLATLFREVALGRLIGDTTTQIQAGWWVRGHLAAEPMHQNTLAVRDRYDRRSLIENTAFREFKQGWWLERYPKETEAAVRGHVDSTLVTCTLAHAFRTAPGQALAGHGNRRQRAAAHAGQVVDFAG